MFDAIVCDPPYGIREGSRQVNVRSETPPPQPGEGGGEGGEASAGGAGHTRVRLAVVDALENLLRFAATSLVVGGRLVYWLPTTADYVPEDCPTHPALRMVANSGQQLSTTVRPPCCLSCCVQYQFCEIARLAQLQLFRRLITMVKTREPTESERAAPAVAQGQAETEGGGAAARLPAHHNLSAKVFGQAGREEDRFLKQPRTE